MNNNSENNSSTNPPVVNDLSLIITAIKIVILAFVLVPFVKYTLLSKQDDEKNTIVPLQNKNESQENTTLPLGVTNETNSIAVKREIVPQPTCPRVDIFLELKKLCSEMVFKFYFCSPEDIHNPKKHKIPKFRIRSKYKNDPTGKCIIVHYMLLSDLVTKEVKTFFFT